MKVCFLLTHVPNPRINKRIGMLKKCSEVFVICTRRKSQNIWEPVYPDVKHLIIDNDLPASESLAKRLVASGQFRVKALKALKEIEPTVLYAEGLDTLLIASKYKRKHAIKVIYEVADLREIFIKHPDGFKEKTVTQAVKLIEKNIFTCVDFLVVTSPKFYEYHYRKYISKHKTLYIPNVPDASVFSDYKKVPHETFTVGFIGGIRYLNQMKMLVDAAEQINIKVLFAGAGGTETDYKQILKYCEGKKDVIFTGKYDYGNEITKLYESVDCVFAVYDADNSNVRIALPNKLYESVVCELPLIVAKSTYLSELVDKWDIGISINHTSTDELMLALKKLRDDRLYYNKLCENCKKIKKKFDVRIYDSKLKEIIDA